MTIVEVVRLIEDRFRKAESEAAEAKKFSIYNVVRRGNTTIVSQRSIKERVDNIPYLKYLSDE